MPLNDTATVDRTFAEVFALPEDQLWAPGLHITKHVATKLVDWPGMFVYVRGDRMLVSAPPRVIARWPAGGVPGSRPDVGQVLTMLGPASRVLGPSRWGFADSLAGSGPEPGDPDAAWHVERTSAERLGDLRAAVGEEAWSESGFDHDPAVVFGMEVGGALVAGANLTSWRTAADDIGVCVHPAHRRRGFGLVVAHAAAEIAIADSGVLRYRALATNVASLRIASRLGVVEHGTQFAVVPR
jgi:GNAT superfamily N-acetyltransferase